MFNSYRYMINIIFFNSYSKLAIMNGPIALPHYLQLLHPYHTNNN